MSNILLNHPAFIQAADISDICKPLQRLNITYFAYVHIDNQQNFTFLNNSPAFLEHYLSNQYYNVDLPSAKTEFGKYVIWDSIERTGLSAKMHTEAAAFGVQHTFNIVEKSETGTSYFYFANGSDCKSINQVYLNNIQLLELFVSYFKNELRKSSILKSVFDCKIKLDKKGPGYSTKGPISLVNNAERDQFISTVSTQGDQSVIAKSVNIIFPDVTFTPREKECLNLTAKGKTAKQIAIQLNLSPRTVEHHLINIKLKLDVNSKQELIEKVNGSVINQYNFI